MNWIITFKSLPGPDEEVLFQLRSNGLVYRGKFDRQNDFINNDDRKKFWKRTDKGNFLLPSLDQSEVEYWIPFPKYNWDETSDVDLPF